MSSVAVFYPAELPSFSIETTAVKRARAVGVLSSSVRPATALEIRPAPEMVPFGISALDELTGGVPRGALTEMVGRASSGRTSVLMALMAEVTRRQEVCALVDVGDSFDPASAEAAGVDLQRVLWVRCGKNSTQPSAVSIQPGTAKMNVPAAEWKNDVAASLKQAITSGCFEAARGRREPASMNKVAPPAKNISWSIHENYDSRLRHAMVNGRGRESHFVERGPSTSSEGHRRDSSNEIRPPRNSAEARKLKWDRLDQALKAADLLIQSGGFGLVIVDLGDIAPELARRIPLTSWFRFVRAVENTPTILMVVAKESCAKTCASLVMELSADAKKSGQAQEPRAKSRESGNPQHSMTHMCLLDGLKVNVQVLRTRLERKPARSVGTSMETQTSWKKTG